MIYRSQIIVCTANKRIHLLAALENSPKPPGMMEMSFSADAHDDDTIVILQTWESKDSCDAFLASMSSEQRAGFAALTASRSECWHEEQLTLSAP